MKGRRICELCINAALHSLNVVLGLLQEMAVEPWFLRLTASGHPKHPLGYRRGRAGLVRFERET